VQREIAGEISSRLREHLTRAQKTKLSNSGTSDPEAYQLYLKGRYYWDKRTPEALNKGRDYFQQAIAGLRGLSGVLCRYLGLHLHSL